jgi:hypothetical protein
VYWLLRWALLVLRGERRAAASRCRGDLLRGSVEDHAASALLHVEHDADHGTRTGPTKPK